MDVFVAYLDPQSGKVLGAYATKTEAEAAIGRAAFAGELGWDGAPTPQVLEFEMDFPIGRQSIEAFIANQAAKDELAETLLGESAEAALVRSTRTAVELERKCGALQAKVAELQGLFDGNDFTYGGYRYTCERA